jgi:sugar/nucleoside kinase (ribokinase family)
VPDFDVTIAGELNLDVILYGLPNELPPDRELLAGDVIFTLGSSSAIVAHNLAALGSKVGFISCVGDDHFGEIAMERLAAMKVDVSQVHRISERKTGLTIILQRDGWRNILTYPGTIFDLSLKHLDLDYLSSSRHFHLSSFYLQRGLKPHVVGLVKRLKGDGLTTSLDCNDDPNDRWDSGIREALRYVDVFLPNAREARRIAGSDDLKVAVDRLSQIVPTLVVKLGAEGAIAQRGAEQLYSPAIKIDVVDPVGAGDSFDAGFLNAFLGGAGLQDCLSAGNVAGALSTTRPGGTEAFRDTEHRERFLCEHRRRIHHQR